MYDLIGYYLNEGDVDKAYEVTQKMDDDTIIEKQTYWKEQWMK